MKAIVDTTNNHPIPSRSLNQFMALNMEIYGPFTYIMEQVMRKDGRLTIIERELLGLALAEMDDCLYAIQSHLEILKKMGVTNPFQYLDNPSPKWAVVLKFAKLVNESSSRIQEEDHVKLIEAGWPNEVGHEIIHIVAVFAFLNRVNNANQFFKSALEHKLEAQHLAQSYLWG